MSVNWEEVPLNNFDPEKRYSPQFTALSDGRRLFINSGDATHLTNNTIIFDSHENAWQKLPDFSEDKQRANGCAVSVPSDTGDTIIVFGGQAIEVSPMVMGNKTDESHAGLPLLNSTIYHTTSQTWAYLSSQINAPLDKIPYEHSATFHPRSGIIYYFGGRNCDSKGYYCNVANLQWGFIFDTKKMTWGRNNYTASVGSQFPSARNGLTTVLGIYKTNMLLRDNNLNVAPDSQHIILYGGHNDSEVVPDIMYTLNLNNNKWTQVNIGTDNSDLARSYHSAVLVNTTLFILFGMNRNTVFSTTILAYNVTDVSNIHQLDYYSSGAIGTNITLGQPNTVASSVPLNSHESLSAGAKAGIAVGSTVGAVVIFSALFLYRKKLTKYMQPAVQGPDEQIMDEKKDLDWHSIERQYFELDTPSTTAVAESLYRISAHQQVLSPDTNPGSTHAISKVIEKSQTPNIEATHTMEGSAQTPDASAFHIQRLSQTPDAVTK
ncbi:hypothetical protein G6F70_002905 [Rhizopus microsporus]|nr:hypothetical protein G6F71_002836 [Rhizopus microsporus]KAG1201705.1 hypothetical protein G6F70_002905 [Rhizopus microsporus]KAG1213720.1 hypothetical protein G6F69_002558 [Rhizopus microsporus]